MTWFGRKRRPAIPFKLLFARFRQLLDNNTRVLQLFADATEKLNGEYVFDRQYIQTVTSQVFDLTGKIAYDINSIADQKYAELYAVLDRLRAEANGDLVGNPVVPRGELCMPFAHVDESQVNLVGGKAAHLGAIRNRLQAPMPEGFAITTCAYLRVLEDNRLGPLIDNALDRFGAGDVDAAEEISARLARADIPADVRKAVKKAIAAAGRKDLFYAVRSSAIGEDEDLSFAGQYKTVLQVAPGDVLDAYRTVLASLYSPSAIAYRRSTGLPAQGLMAVACMHMVSARCAGVLYTVDPTDPQSGRALVSATPGLGNRAVQGGQSMARYVVARASPYAVLEYRHAVPPDMVVARAEGGLATAKVPAQLSTERPLSDEDVARLLELSLRIERYFKQPQDIEWAQDADGSLVLIQARRLTVSTPPALPRALPEALAGHRILMEKCGYVACRGVAAGPVFVVRGDGDLDRFPAGGVLVTRRASPKLIRAIPRAAAIITDIGAPTGHMAALAREFRVPAVVDCGEATVRLPEGAEVTVDADDNKIYAGRIEELLQYQLVAESGIEDAPEYRLLRRLLRRITPLAFVDPQAETFRAARCRTVHDIIRFAHEKAVEELVNLHGAGAAGGAEAARRVEADLPIGLHVIDLGGGLDPLQVGHSPRAAVKPEALRSAPMRALWEGMTTPGVWHRQPVGVDLRTFLSSAMTSRSPEEMAGVNLAVVAEDYVNLSLKLGYHYNMIDAYLTDSRDANHVYFRFVGGASDGERRRRRSAMVREILERLDFAARQTGDLVIARMRKLPRAETEERLKAIGRLIGYTRQLDALMHSEDDATHYVEAFLRGDYSLE